MQKIKKIIAALALGATGLNAFSQTTNLFPNGTQPVNPVISISNTFTVIPGYMIANDNISSAKTNNYLNGTNYVGQSIYPLQTANMRFLSLGIIATDTNSGDNGVITALIQGSAGLGDWSTWTNIAVTLNGSNTVSSSIYSLDSGGWTQFRCAYVTNTDANAHSAAISVGLGGKRGF